MGISIVAQNEGYKSEDFRVESGERKVECRMISPLKAKIHQDPILYMTFTLNKEDALTAYPYFVAVNHFLNNGHRILSFDIPNHGSRVDKYGYGIEGFCNAYIDGADPFKTYIEDAKAIMDYCISSGFAKPGRIVIGGTSRSGYLAFRLLAEEDRISAAAGFAPVTDWNDIGFDYAKGKVDTSCLKLTNFVEKLAGKHIFIAVGNHDESVNTASCTRFYLDLLEANTKAGYDGFYVDFYCTDDPGHTCSGPWYTKAADFMIKHST